VEKLPKLKGRDNFEYNYNTATAEPVIDYVDNISELSLTSESRSNNNTGE